MALSAKLCNATPFAVEIAYEKGIVLKIPGDSSISLTTIQLDSFDPSKPGWEENRILLEGKGLFLLDTDLSYDAQSLKALKACIKLKRERVNGFVERLEVVSTKDGGIVDERKIKVAKDKAGISRLEGEIELLERRVSTLEEILGPQTKRLTPAETFDPARTCFAMSPPKEFPSKLSLQLFLDENPELREKNDAILAKMKKKAGPDEA